MTDNSTEERLIQLANSGDDEALELIMKNYKPLVLSRARAYFIIGAEAEDLIQEGMFGLFKAVRDYDSQKNPEFAAFADLCIRRQLISALKGATRQKHSPLNSYVSLNRPVAEDSERTMMDMLGTNRVDDPEALLISKEKYININKKIEELLSDFEKKVLAAYLAGESYRDIARELEASPKSVDNALQRIKKKLERPLGVNK
ncbi:MAG: RNA polymerase sporulation sigma factor SigH [Clostridia bacterium]|nr:RNA polymerase sporulation sigma factor SigH [Clostridia bacterium]